MKCKDCGFRHTNKEYARNCSYTNMTGFHAETVIIRRCRKCGWIAVVEDGKIIKQFSNKNKFDDSRRN